MIQLMRYAKAAGRVAETNWRRPRVPLKVNLCLTYWCQYRCRTCNIWQRAPKDELSTQELKTFASRTTGVSWLDLTGGEIFLRPDIADVLGSFCSEWRDLVLLHFPTNGFLTRRIVDVTSALARQRGAVDLVVTVSVDGPEALNDEIRGMRSGFRRQLETYQELRRTAGVKAVIGMTLSRWNVGQVAATFEACRAIVGDLAPEEFHLNVAQTSTHYYGHESASHQAPREVILDEVRAYRASRAAPRDLAGWLEARYLTHLAEFVRTGDLPMRCHALRSSCFVDPWGTVYPCITYDRPVGRLRDHDMDLAAIWHSREATDVQREIWAGDCPRCWTACEAYQSVLGNTLRVWDGPPAAKLRARTVS